MLSQDPTYPLFPIFACIGLILSLIPLSWHVQAWNSGTCAFMVWTALSCFVSFVNSIVWSGNVNNPAPVWCDISSKVIIGVSVGIPAATLCISRRLYYITSGSTGSITRDDKRRMVMVDMFIAVGIPILAMILHYIVQGHRFDILEDFGCFPVVYNTIPAYALYFVWPLVLGAISFVFSALTLRSFWIRRLQFTQLITSNTSMSVSRYLRLVMLALIDIMCTTPLGIFSIYISNRGIGLAPWISWEDTHYNFSHVSLVPALLWRSDASFRASVELTRWLPVACSYLFFALFGFSSEARKFYATIFWGILKVCGVRPASQKPTIKGLASWAKPLKLSSTTTNTSVATLPAYTSNTRAPASPASFDTTSKAPHRPWSFDTITSTCANTHVELEAYSKENFDIEKFGGKFRLSLPPFYPLDSDASTLCNSPTSRHQLTSSPPSMPRRLPSHIPEDVSSIPLPSPWSLDSNHEQFVVLERDSIYGDVDPQAVQPPTPSSSFLPQSRSQTRADLQLPLAPGHKSSESSMSQRTIGSPHRDRFYIVSADRSKTPSSPAPFSSSCSRSSSRENVSEGDEIQAGTDEQRRADSPNTSRVNVIQVMVQTTETRNDGVV